MGIIFEDLAMPGHNVLIIFRTGRNVSFKVEDTNKILDEWINHKSSFIKCAENLIIRRSAVELLLTMDESMEEKTK